VIKSTLKYLPVILFFFFVTRNLNWDSGFQLHPDERFITQSIQAGFTQEYYDSHFFVYGTLPVHIVQKLSGILPGIPLVILQRSISTFAFAVIILFLSLTARQLGGSPHVAAWLGVTSIGLIQQSHFGTVDMPGIAFILAAFFYRRRRLLFGALSGCAAACKIHFGIILLVAPWPSSMWSALIAFRVLQPESFVGIDINPHWIEALRTQAALAVPNFSYPPSVQWFGNPWWNSIWDIASFGMGIGGFVLCLYGLTRKRPRSLLLPSCLFLAPCLLSQNHYLRYALPAYPFLYLYAAAAAKSPRAAPLVVVCMLSAVIWAVRFTSIYSHDNTRVAAAKWAAENLADGKVVYEEWDDPLPVRFREVSFLKVYAIPFNDAPLADADYFIITSQRALNSVGRLLPEQNSFYHYLSAGGLNFKLLKSFEGTEWRGLDESATVYDSAPVWIFQKESRIP
jgi:hypothetical protein